jgi:NADPH-dependent 2,4-dienoyl-CoA reductase/sulfur reductase-like enzyme
VTPRRIVVVGSSLAGLRACETLRREGFAGTITCIGDEPHLPYDRPPLSKQFLRAEWESDRLSLRRGGFDDLELEWRLGVRACALDLRARQVELTGGARVAYDGLVIATGAAPRQLPGTPPLRGIHVLRTLDDAVALRAALRESARVLVVGCGFIGAEVAASCRRMGLEVVAVEPAPAPCMRGLGRTIGAAIARLHRDQGVDLRCGTHVVRFEGGARLERAELSDGTRIEVDVAIVGIGATPATDWLEGSGLELADGVVCDATCAASAPDVVAAGDVARAWHPLHGEALRIEHWTHAVEQGVAAAQRLLHGPEVPAFAPVPLVWSDQYDVKIQLAGVTRPDDELCVLRGVPGERGFVGAYLRSGRLVGGVVFNEPRALIRLRQAIARGAGEGDLAAFA